MCIPALTLLQGLSTCAFPRCQPILNLELKRIGFFLISIQKHHVLNFRLLLTYVSNGTVSFPCFPLSSTYLPLFRASSPVLTCPHTFEAKPCQIFLISLVLNVHQSPTINFLTRTCTELLSTKNREMMRSESCLEMKNLFYGS